MPSMFNGILQLVMTTILVTNVLIPTLKAANTTGTNASGVWVGQWSASEIAVFSLASLAAIFGLVNGIANIFGLGY